MEGFAARVWALHVALFDPVWDPYKAVSLRNFRCDYKVEIDSLSAPLGLGSTRGLCRPVMRTCAQRPSSEHYFHRIHSGEGPQPERRSGFQPNRSAVPHRGITAVQGPGWCGFPHGPAPSFGCSAPHWVL